MKIFSLFISLFCLICLSLFFVIPSQVDAFILDNAAPFSLQSPMAIPESYQSFSQTTNQSQNISLDTWLKSKYLGIDITILNSTNKTPTKARPLELISTKDSFLFNVIDQNQQKYRVKVIFESNTATSFQKQSQLDQTNPLGNARLQVEQYITQATQTILGGEVSSTALSSAQMDNILPQNVAQKNGEQIQYRDSKTKSAKNGMLIISNNDIMLTDGSPLSISFEKEK